MISLMQAVAKKLREGDNRMNATATDVQVDHEMMSLHQAVDSALYAAERAFLHALSHGANLQGAIREALLQSSTITIETVAAWQFADAVETYFGTGGDFLHPSVNGFFRRYVQAKQQRKNCSKTCSKDGLPSELGSVSADGSMGGTGLEPVTPSVSCTPPAIQPPPEAPTKTHESPTPAENSVTSPTQTQTDDTGTQTDNLLQLEHKTAQLICPETGRAMVSQILPADARVFMSIIVNGKRYEFLDRKQLTKLYFLHRYRELPACPEDEAELPENRVGERFDGLG